MEIRAQVIERFMRYVRVDSQSKEGVTDRYPSTDGQLVLAKLLKEELSAMGLSDVVMDSHGIVTATLPGNGRQQEGTARKGPVVGLLAHLDTYPEVSGKDVNPLVHERYAGNELILPALPDQPIHPEDNPELLRYKGDDIITSDGSTLLGADDKAGIAEIMTLLDVYRSNPGILHPTLRIAFTPDEEIGAGTTHFDVKAFGADVAYTLDGSGMGEVEDETFCADSAKVTIKGIDVHPGYAKDKMVNALRVAATFMAHMPGEHSPEHTEDRQSYLHPYQISGNVSEVQIVVLVRSFSNKGLLEMEQLIEKAKEEVMKIYPRAQITTEINESYRNMKEVLDNYPQVVTFAEEAIRQSALSPVRKAIRGGTDGARLSFMGLPTPNLSAGGYNFHSRQEWIPVGAMVKAVEVLVALMRIWVEQGLT